MAENREDDEFAVNISVEQLQLAVVMKSLAKTVVAPFDRVKFLLQCEGELARLGKIDTPLRGPLNCVRRCNVLEGGLSLWRGNLIQLVGILPSALSEAFVGLPVQRAAYQFLPHNSESTEMLALWGSSAAGAVAASLVSYPFDFMRFRLACDTKPFLGACYEYRHSLDLIAHPNIVDNPHLIYRGMGLYLVGSIAYRTLFLAMLQVVAPFLPPEGLTLEFKPFLAQTLCGFAMMSMGHLALYPADTVRRRMMLAINHRGMEYPTVMSCVHHLLRTEGMGGFYRGAGFTVFRGAVTTSVALVLGGVSD